MVAPQPSRDGMSRQMLSKPHPERLTKQQVAL
jgi:hypothetical protein